jgi:sugar lactone lactonase YvrE
MRRQKTRRGLEHLAYSPAGRLLVGRDVRNDVQVWDARTLEPVETVPAGDPREKLLDCLFRPGGLSFLLAEDYCSAAQDLPAGAPRPEHQRVLPGPWAPDAPYWRYWPGYAWTSGPRHWCGFGPGGRTFVGWHPGAERPRLGLWRFDGTCERALPWMEDWFVNDLAFSPDGHFLAAALYANYEMGLADLQTEPPAVRILPHSDQPVRAAWSPAAPLVACAARRSVWLWDAPTVECVHRFAGFRKTAEALAFSPDGSLLAAGSREGRVRVWETASGREKADLDWQTGKINAMAFSPDGCTLAAAGSKGVVLWDVD